MAIEPSIRVGSVQAQLSVSFEVRVTCSNCKGTGLKRGSRCRKCKGIGGKLLTETVTKVGKGKSQGDTSPRSGASTDSCRTARSISLFKSSSRQTRCKGMAQ